MVSELRVWTDVQTYKHTPKCITLALASEGNEVLKYQQVQVISTIAPDPDRQ